MKAITWRFLDTAKGSAFFNMALDEAIVEAVANGHSLPTFRLYGWDPAAITIGYSQKAGDVLDYGRCIEDGISVTRRLTGGRAVFHDCEAAYSVVGPIHDPLFGCNLSATYRAIGAVLLEALRSCGAEVDWSRGNPASGEERRVFSSAPCFLSTSRFEITCRGRKMVGSAQRRFREVFLQHGSILTGPGHERIGDYLKESHDTASFATVLSRKSIDLDAALGRPVDTGTLKASLFESFARAAGGQVTREEPSPRETEYARFSIHERYSSKGWVLGYG
ncbi:MAG: lipoate--protein ligase family protein [Candidatus Latescibacter sp.]|nr:lipoate--protein ligase family protein [Candidatus Latescibacter sp.]